MTIPPTGDDDGPPLWTFTMKHAASTKNNMLCGLTLPLWAELAWRERAHIDWCTYWRRVLSVHPALLQ